LLIALTVLLDFRLDSLRSLFDLVVSVSVQRRRLVDDF
jgi:hypothetical protein